MNPFSYATISSDVVFGPGALAKLPAELARLGFSRALVLTTPEQRDQAEALRTLLGSTMAGAFTDARMHVPIETAKAGVIAARACMADCTIGFGGGSTIGLGKAIALDLGLPQIAVDTTYAGSSRTSIYGLTEGGVKRTGSAPGVMPRLVIYDPVLTYTLPARTTAASGMNAMAHCIEALYSQQRNPITTIIATEGLRELGWAIPRAVDAPNDLDARTRALYGAFLAGTALGTVGMALHHKLCHTLGGSFDLPHAETHSIVLAHVVRYNEVAAAPEMALAARAFGSEDAAQTLFAMLSRMKLPTSLRELGLPASALDRAADLATQNPYYNPRPIDRPSIRALLDDAYHGRLAPRATGYAG